MICSQKFICWILGLQCENETLLVYCKIIYLKGNIKKSYTHTHTELYFLVDSKCLQQPGPSQAKARSPDLYQGLSHRQECKHLGHLLLVLQAHYPGAGKQRILGWNQIWDVNAPRGDLPLDPQRLPSGGRTSDGGDQWKVIM